MRMTTPMAALALLALTACSGETTDDTTAPADDNYYGGEVAGQAEGNAVSGIELPDLSPELAAAATERGTLRCMLPLLPDWEAGEVLNDKQSDVRFQTSSSPQEVAAFYTAAVLDKKGDVAVAGGGNEVEITVHAQDMHKCKISAKPGSGGKTEVTVLLTGFGERK